MYVPPHFKIDELGAIHATMRASRLATLVTATADGLMGTPLPLILDEREGDHGTLYGHVARPNPQWQAPALGEAMAIFTGPDAYVTPSWYVTKAEHGKVVPTWNYVAVHAYGPAEFFEDADRLLDVVTRLTSLHESSRAEVWQVSDAPADFVKAQLRGIIGIRMPITRIDAKKKMSQNRKLEDRAGVVAGLSVSDNPIDREVAAMIPMD
ncbi:FMN-binding negative transcriptional regulator [Bradyrhizobium sp. ISRA443]|uniref:FMN-binding negative transcriptional regulator n=1 Tax=unclassified Bradyrhizobium TaxID=2631580 RepID=UPI002479C143|nr:MULTISPECIES: FMN-binding negative transcriptional regulator [unclassified Bradyrhizobium]WGR95086.1 FMN-binding negative transcriptional regulator [Bradyrhizobium sp. ISRA435]WGR99978.1 FMN-binding negative transcriptional regulator [Bradyrhizobium sp. ISRA436]WGS06869.1 FMN-binding negative transcriptional regulator [Bradyrhizobium sp. ISRA437]WGS13751.1 FMN-binding negative transcriptional regulator [Bradyrhizobium sp. ISRA443]